MPQGGAKAHNQQRGEGRSVTASSCSGCNVLDGAWGICACFYNPKEQDLGAIDQPLPALARATTTTGPFPHCFIGAQQNSAGQGHGAGRAVCSSSQGGHNGCLYTPRDTKRQLEEDNCLKKKTNPKQQRALHISWLPDRMSTASAPRFSFIPLQKHHFPGEGRGRSEQKGMGNTAPRGAQPRSPSTEPWVQPPPAAAPHRCRPCLAMLALSTAAGSVPTAGWTHTGWGGEQLGKSLAGFTSSSAVL